jgi:predicted DNA-binding transcriptional regulator YafY
MAGLAYRRLGEHLPLPTPLSPDVLDRLAAALPTAQTVAARHAADQLAESLAAALRGYLGLPFWQTDDPAADPLPLIEQAIAAKQDLVITYHGAGREQAVVRRVTPYWLERRDGVPYLIAYCHLRGAERVFRVDRITECRPVTG